MDTKPGGHITVFLSLILLMLLSLVFTLLESARSEGIRLRACLAANSGIESVFAQFDRVLWDDYGLLFFMDRYGDAEELKEEALKYAQKNRGSGWLEFSAEDISVEKYVLAVDDNGKVFEQAAAEYMKKAGLAELALSFSESIFKTINETGLKEPEEFSFEDINEKVEEIAEDMAEARSVRTDNNPDVKVPADAEKNAEDYRKLINTYEKLRSRGLLMAVCEDVDEISEEPYKDEAFPSKLSSAQKARNAGLISEDNLLDGALLREYCLEKFDSYTDGDRDFMELEYLICGKDSPLANMSSAVKRLTAVRLGLNLVYLMQDAQKKSEAELMAFIIAGWTGIEPVVEAVKLLIQLIWAFVEAVNDVKSLVAGGRVELIKNSKNWQLSLGDAAEGKSAAAGRDGWNYEEYLRLLLYLTGKEKLSYRAMDIIQSKIIQSEPAFAMKNCVYAAKIKLYASAGSMFPYLPGTINYRYEPKSAYCYGTLFF